MDNAQTLDPQDWESLRALGHRMMDDMVDHLAGLRDRPVWQHMPQAARATFDQPLPRTPTPLAAVYETFTREIAPYATGNTHPGFMGWVHGGGTPVGMLAELLAGALNSNLGARDHAGVVVERQVIRWAAEMVGMPPTTSGLLVTGSSIANFIGVLVASRTHLGPTLRTQGLAGTKLTAYASAAAHGCVPRALDLAGLGTEALRLIPADPDHRIIPAALVAAIAEDRAAGRTPFLIVGTAGTVDCGAVDDLAALAAIAKRESLWFHVDGAFGATACLSHTYRPLLAGIEHADSLAFDFHKWAQVPYDAGCILVRDPQAQLDTFAQNLAYLAREPRGLAGGHPWPCDMGPDLSRGFRALKVWMTLATYGADRLGAVVDRACAVAQHLAARIDADPTLQRVAPVALNIVCFRVLGLNDAAHRDLVAEIQLSGLAAPSTTVINGQTVVRAAIVNHRTQEHDVDVLLDTIGKVRQGLCP